MRSTVKAAIPFQGTGLHSGRMVRLRLCPAASGTGIVFRRTDVALDQGTIPARYDLVTDTTLCTKLTNEFGVSVGTVEHLMAALAGSGVSDALITLDGPEVPIMDGSAVPFVRGILSTGVRALPGVYRALRIEKPVEVVDGERVARLLPAERFELAFEIDFADAAIGCQTLERTVTGAAFVHELADCRTFGRLSDVEMLRRAGLARGGSLENAVVVDGGKVLNPGGLRRSDEFVRHKMLDAVGDLALAGAPIIGRYEGARSGHEMTNRLLHALFADPGAFRRATARADLVPAAGAEPVERDRLAV
ncbi:MAG: UDP-3-O-acyl-N-acetylglucosamine deacetylase [Pseudomonadota bacterium]